MEKQTINLGFGSVNLSTQRATIAALRVVAPFTRDSAIDTAAKAHGTRTFTNVSRFPKVNGSLINDDCFIPEGTVIMLQSSWSRGGMPIRNGAVFLRTRVGAALLNVVAKLPVGRESLIGDTHSVFRGHADILSADDAEVFRIKIPARYMQQFMSPVEVSECFDIRELRPESIRRPEAQLVVTPAGLATLEVAAPMQRRMRFRN
ncbi:MAG: hypothetical protein RSE62_03140 [Citrobacter sp.]